jgi:hypothetical protein
VIPISSFYLEVTRQYCDASTGAVLRRLLGVSNLEEHGNPNVLYARFASGHLEGVVFYG